MKQWRKLLLVFFAAYLMASSFLAPQGNELWRFITGGRIRSQPAMGRNGTVYFISEDRYLYALDREGIQLWRCDVHGRVSDCFCIGYDGTIYLGLKNGRILAINPRGRIIWEYDTRDEIDYSPALLCDGTLFFIGRQGKLTALSHSGELRFQINLQQNPAANPVTDADGTLYLPLRPNRLLALFPWGERKWEIALEGDPSAPAIASDGTLIVGTDQGNLYAIAPDGIILWTHAFNAGIISPVLGKNDTIFTALKTGQALALNKNGSLLWMVRVGKTVSSSCNVGSSGTVYIPSGDNFLHALSPSGTILWSLPVNGVLTPPVLSDQGMLYAGSSDWSVYAFKMEKPMESAWPQFQHDPRHSSHSLRIIGNSFMDDLYGENPDYQYFKNLLFSDDTALIEKGLAAIQARYEQLNIGSGKPYLLYFLARCAGRSVLEAERNRTYPFSGYSAIREQACLLYTLIGGFSSRELLLKIVAEDRDTAMKGVAIRCLGLLKSDPEGAAVMSMASLITQNRQTSPDNRVAREIIQSLAEIARYHGLLPQEGVRTLLAIANGNYLAEVKELALTALDELK